jgi:hypothetical protein
MTVAEDASPADVVAAELTATRVIVLVAGRDIRVLSQDGAMVLTF